MHLTISTAALLATALASVATAQSSFYGAGAPSIRAERTSDGFFDDLGALKHRRRGRVAHSLPQDAPRSLPQQPPAHPASAWKQTPPHLRYTRVITSDQLYQQRRDAPAPRAYFPAVSAPQQEELIGDVVDVTPIDVSDVAADTAAPYDFHAELADDFRLSSKLGESSLDQLAENGYHADDDDVEQIDDDVEENNDDVEEEDEAVYEEDFTTELTSAREDVLAATGGGLSFTYSGTVLGQLSQCHPNDANLIARQRAAFLSAAKNGRTEILMLLLHSCPEVVGDANLLREALDGTTTAVARLGRLQGKYAHDEGELEVVDRKVRAVQGALRLLRQEINGQL